MSPTRISDDVKCYAVEVRAALECSGLDYGPISVHDKMNLTPYTDHLTPPGVHDKMNPDSPMVVPETSR